MGCFLGVRRICCLWALPRVRSCGVFGGRGFRLTFSHTPPLSSSLLFYLLVSFGSSLDRRPVGPRFYGQLCLDLVSFSSLLSLRFFFTRPWTRHTFLFLFITPPRLCHSFPKPAIFRRISSHLPVLACCWTPANLTNFAVPTQVEHGCLPAASFLDFCSFLFFFSLVGCLDTSRQ